MQKYSTAYDAHTVIGTSYYSRVPCGRVDDHIPIHGSRRSDPNLRWGAPSRQDYIKSNNKDLQTLSLCRFIKNGIHEVVSVPCWDHR